MASRSAGCVAEALGERPAGFEVELALGLERDLLVHALDALLELARVELADLGGHRTTFLSGGDRLGGCAPALEPGEQLRRQAEVGRGHGRRTRRRAARRARARRWSRRPRTARRRAPATTVAGLNASRRRGGLTGSAGPRPDGGPRGSRCGRTDDALRSSRRAPIAAEREDNDRGLQRERDDDEAQAQPRRRTAARQRVACARHRSGSSPGS